MPSVKRSAVITQVRRTISAYRDKVHEVRNDTAYLPPEGARIVNEYCLNRNDEQTLVQDAIWDSSFLDMMDDGLLLEYCAVCKELDEALGLGSWSIGSVDRIVKDEKGFWETLWGALQGEFNEDQTGREILIDMGLNFIPFVGQACDARDIAACLKKLVIERRVNEIGIWVTLLLTAIGCVPYAGDVVKAGCKAILKGADDVFLAVLKRIDAENAYRGFLKFRSKFVSSIDKAIEMVCRWIEEARKSKYGSKVDSVLASARENLRKSVEFMRERIDEIGERLFGKGRGPKIRNAMDMMPQKYRDRAQKLLSDMPEEQRREVTECIEELYRKYGDPGKTIQEHHWIEQSRIRNREEYPFLSSPPMEEDLLKSKSNLSLIVGHNGGHKKKYNDLLDGKLKYIKDSLDQQCMELNISLEKLMQDNDIKKMINNKIKKTITEMQDAVKKDSKIMNNIEKMFVLD